MYVDLDVAERRELIVVSGSTFSRSHPGLGGGRDALHERPVSGIDPGSYPGRHLQIESRLQTRWIKQRKCPGGVQISLSSEQFHLCSAGRT